ncbi:MAG: hypothetical protein ACRD22_16195 [Terriglobia bacterium]
MDDREHVLSKINSLRQSFCFSLGAYALLTQEPAMSQVANYNVCVTNKSLTVFQEGHQHKPDSNLSYRIAFNASLPSDAALEVVRTSFYAMLAGSFEAVKHWERVRLQSWYHFARHVRNAASHNGLFHFSDSSGLPVTWRNLTIAASMQDMALSEFLGWFDGLQLNASMNLFIDRGIET